jgi:serine/threonine protein kinase
MLSAGNKLGPYEIQDLLGAGGMGEVYRARDPRIGREVAVKILPSIYSEDLNRLTRFQQEARAAGLLNHPNILAIYDVGTENGSPYLVSELLNGETLREKLDGGPLPKRKSMDYALQTIKGLTAAHEKGIIHRDLKPENLFITKDGRVKILDFGLAKLIAPEPIASEHSKLETANLQSQPGVILGTVGYMSPEQVRGQSADHRSDIFSFGAIFYEMMTGKKAFHAETHADTISAILNKDPTELAEGAKSLPVGLQRILDRCIEKDPAERFQSAHDLTFALEAVSGSTDSNAPALESRPAHHPVFLTRKFSFFWAAAACVLFLVSLIFGFNYFRIRSKVPPSSQVRFTILPEENTGFANTTFPMVSPDGKKIVFLASDSTANRRLYIRDLDSFGPRKLPGTEGAFSGFWSADSRSIGFFSQGKLNKVDIQSGTVQAICDASIGRGGTWNHDNVIIFAASSNTELSRVSAFGGQPEPITELDPQKESSHRFPQFLPDGKHFLFLSFGSGTGNGIYVGSLGSKEKKFLTSSTMNAIFAPPDSLFFVQQSILMVQQFDPVKLLLIGEARPVVQQVGFVGATGQATFSVSENGVLAYRSLSDLQNSLTILNREGKTINSVGPRAAYEDPSISPDGMRLAVTRDDLGNAQTVWIYDFSRNIFSRFTFNSLPCDDPSWSSDGQKIVFAADGNLYVKPTTGSQPEKLLYKDQFDKVPIDWSGDGRSILFSIAAPKTGLDINLLPPTGKPYPLLNSDFNESFAQISPDGNWLAYASSETGPLEVYVRTFPDLGKGKWQVSSGGGVQPRWRKDGKELFYLGPDRTLMVASITATANHFDAGTPQRLFQAKVLGWDPRRPEYDVFPDGQRFLFNLVGSSSLSRATFVTPKR